MYIALMSEFWLLSTFVKAAMNIPVSKFAGHLIYPASQYTIGALNVSPQQDYDPLDERD